MAVLTLLYISALVSSSFAFTPVVLWHGMGDSCCSEGSIGRIVGVLEREMPNTTVVSLKFGDSTMEDIESGYFADANTLVAEACKMIADNPAFESGYNTIGFSQGGQFLRAVAQRCPSPPMRTLVSLGGQHQGVYGLPRCGQPNPGYCDYIRRLLNYGAYIGWIQRSLVQAQYWHDPLHEETYRNYSIFLADINNEKEPPNDTYKENLAQLERLVLVKFSEDSMVAPRESSWFGFYAPGQAENVLSYVNTELYQQDKIGLQTLDRDGKLEFVETSGDHLQFTEDWLVHEIIERYLLD